MAAGSLATICRTAPVESWTSADAAIRRGSVTIASNALRVPEPSSRVITAIDAFRPPTKRQFRIWPA